MRKNSPPFFGIDEFFRDDVRDQRENKREDEKVCPRRQQQRTPLSVMKDVRKRSSRVFACCLRER